jgi:hypothetical protein
MGKMKRVGVRLAVIAVIGAMTPAVLGAGAAYASTECSTYSWKTIKTNSSASSPWTTKVELQAQIDTRFNVTCTDYFRTKATATSSNSDGAGGTLTATLTANSITNGSVTVPAGVQGSWYAYAYGHSNVYCVSGKATFRSMSPSAPVTCAP